MASGIPIKQGLNLELAPLCYRCSKPCGLDSKRKNSESRNNLDLCQTKRDCSTWQGQEDIAVSSIFQKMNDNICIDVKKSTKSIEEKKSNM